MKVWMRRGLSLTLAIVMLFACSTLSSLASQETGVQPLAVGAPELRAEAGDEEQPNGADQNAEPSPLDGQSGLTPGEIPSEIAGEELSGGEAELPPEGEFGGETDPGDPDNPDPVEPAEPVEVAVSWSGEASCEWDGSAHTPSASANGVQLGEVTYTSGQAPYTEIGSYTVQVSLANPEDTQKYTLTNTTFSFSIVARKVQINWSVPTTYTGGDQTSAVKATYQDVAGATQACTVNVAEGAVLKAGAYNATAAIDDAHYEAADPASLTKSFTLARKAYVVMPAAGQYKYYGADDPALSYTLIAPEGESALPAGYVLSYEGAGIQATAGMHNYVIVAGGGADENCSVTLAEGAPAFEVKALPITLKTEQTKKYYGAPDPAFTYTLTLDPQAQTKLTAEAVTQALAQVPLRRAAGENAGPYAFSLDAGANYAVTIEPASFTIEALPVTVKPAEGQAKIYGADDPAAYDYSVEIATMPATGTQKTPEAVKRELGAVLRREAGEDVGIYAFSLADEVNPNYTVTLASSSAAFAIDALAVEIVPDAQSKTYGTVDPDEFTYTLKYDRTATKLEYGEILEELMQPLAEDAQLIERSQGENIGMYSFALPKGYEAGNFTLSVAQDPQFEIKADLPVSVNELDSRSSALQFTIQAEEDEEALSFQEGVHLYLKVEADFSTAISNDVHYEAPELDDIFNGTTEKDAFYVDLGEIAEGLETGIGEIEYSSDIVEEVTWFGNLPAGTKLTLTPVDENHAPVVGKKIEVTVEKAAPALAWYSPDPDTPVTAPKGLHIGPNQLGGLDVTGRPNEYVMYIFTMGENDYAKVDQLDEEGRLAVDVEDLTVYNEASAHLEQGVEAFYLDALNLAGDELTGTFYYDDVAFPIPANDIVFENRSDTVKITLPEEGTITALKIQGLTEEPVLPTTSAATHEIAVSWSGMSLIASGTPVEVTYRDLANNEVTSQGETVKSKVSTPIRFSIRPDTNEFGYLNGKNSRLIISGSACSCEPILVTVGDIGDTVYASQSETWSDTNGNWDMIVDMSRLPEGRSFTISAQYVDVIGTGRSISAIFDSECGIACVTSPVYDAINYISGMAEPNSSVSVIINDDKVYRAEVDAYGRFYASDLPVLLAGDVVIIRVVDIAGNSSDLKLVIPEPNLDNTTTSKIYPLGKIFYETRGEDDSFYAMATPVTLADVSEGALSLPLLLGGSYEAGELTISPAEGGIAVNSMISEQLRSQSEYAPGSEGLYVYREKPTVRMLKEKSGEKYEYGQVIPLGEGERVWIVDEHEVEFMADVLFGMNVHDFTNDERYEAYQES